MIKVFCVSLLTLTFCLLGVGCASAKKYEPAGIRTYPIELEGPLFKIQQLPESNQILQQVLKEGEISFAYQLQTQAAAYWDASKRKIVLNPKLNRSEGAYISSILFELHNAYSSTALVALTDQAVQGRIDKETYVKSVEKLEYENALKACALLNLGIKKNIFPKDAYWEVMREFEDHYLLQQLNGHSDWIAANYDRMHVAKNTSPFKGTLGEFEKLPEKERKDLMRYLSIKNDFKSNERDIVARAAKFLGKELDELEVCVNGESKTPCKRVDERLQLLAKVFAGNPVYENRIMKSKAFRR